MGIFLNNCALKKSVSLLRGMEMAEEKSKFVDGVKKPGCKKKMKGIVNPKIRFVIFSPIFCGFWGKISKIYGFLFHYLLSH